MGFMMKPINYSWGLRGVAPNKGHLYYQMTYLLDGAASGLVIFIKSDTDLIFAFFDGLTIRTVT